ncbi:MAG: adenosylcobinamide-phosphate synthase CbiB [Candidatus Omnitrophota bacterium]
MHVWSAIVCAYCLDLLLGDPAWLPHPVRMIGRAITRLEAALRNIFKNERAAGVVLTMSVVGGVYLGVAGIVLLAGAIHPYAGWAATVGALYFAFATKDLSAQSMGVYRALNEEDLALARSRLSMIVGRDTASLSKEEIVRATVETVAEGTVDGIVAPLFYALLGGAPLALAYKAVNTLDSMVGYRNERYVKFGWASAKLDDAANYIPARLSAFFLPLAAVITGNDGRESLATARRDGRKHPSPNSGISEAAMAGALNVTLGGLSHYNGVVSNKPHIGSGTELPTKDHIEKSVRISLVASFLAVLFVVILKMLMR